MNNYMCDGARPNYTQYFVILLSRSNSFREHCAKVYENDSDFDHHEKRTEILYKVRVKNMSLLTKTSS